MRTSKFVKDGLHKCDSCERVWYGGQLDDIAALYERIEAGGKVPSGECPDKDCGALCFPSEDTSTDQWVEALTNVLELLGNQHGTEAQLNKTTEFMTDAVLYMETDKAKTLIQACLASLT